MQETKKIQWAFFLSGLTDVLLFDQITKFLVVRGTIGEVSIIRDFFYLTASHRNDGIAFGINLPMWLQISGSMLILVLLVKFGFEQMPRTKVSMILGNILLGGVIGGGLGNLIDRVLHGYVVDFIVLRPFPVFNVADVGITVGLFALFATIVLSKNKN